MDPWAPSLSFVLVCASLRYVSLALVFWGVDSYFYHLFFHRPFSLAVHAWQVVLHLWPSLTQPAQTHTRSSFSSSVVLQRCSHMWVLCEALGEQVEAEVRAVLGSVLAGCSICCSPLVGQLVCWDVACRLGEAAGARPPAVGTAWLPGAWLSGWHHLARSRGAGGLSCVGRLAWKNRCQLASPGAEYWEPAGQL